MLLRTLFIYVVSKMLDIYEVNGYMIKDDLTDLPPNNDGTALVPRCA